MWNSRPTFLSLLNVCNRSSTQGSTLFGQHPPSCLQLGGERSVNKFQALGVFMGSINQLRSMITYTSHIDPTLDSISSTIHCVIDLTTSVATIVVDAIVYRHRYLLYRPPTTRIDGVNQARFNSSNPLRRMRCTTSIRCTLPLCWWEISTLDDLSNARSHVVCGQATTLDDFVEQQPMKEYM